MAAESPSASKQSKAFLSFQKLIQRPKLKITDVQHKHSVKAASVSKLKVSSDMLLKSPSASKQSKAFVSLQKSIERQKLKITDVELKHSDKAASVSKLKEFSDMLLNMMSKESNLHEECQKELRVMKVMNSSMSSDMETIKKEVEQMSKELEESKIIKQKLEQVTKELQNSEWLNVRQQKNFTKAIEKELEESRIIKEKLEQITKELEESKKIKEKLKLISKELEESKSLNDLQQKNFSEEIRKNLMQISSLQMAAMKQQNGHKDVLKLAEDLKDKEEQLNAKTVQLEIQQKRKQQLVLENHQLKIKLEVMKIMEDEFLKTVGDLHTSVMEKEQLCQELQDYCQSVIIKERKSSDELQKARKRMIEGIAGRSSRGASIGVKRMGQLENGPFLEAFRAKERCYRMRAARMCSVWEKNLKDPHWYPFKIITIGGESKEIIDEEDKKLKGLKMDMGDGPYQAVVRALTEMNEYNASGRFVVSELWNHGEERRATLEEGVEFLLGRWITKKQKTQQTGTDDCENSDNDNDEVPPADNSDSDSYEVPTADNNDSDSDEASPYVGKDT